MATVEEQARAGLELFNRGDLDAMREVLAPGIVYEETGTGRRLTGRDDVLAAFRDWRTGLPDSVGTIERMIVDGDTVAMEVTWRGTHSGTLKTPSGELPATGRPTEIRATQWQVWRDGLLVSDVHHLDVLSLLAQVGALGLAA